MKSISSTFLLIVTWLLSCILAASLHKRMDPNPSSSSSYSFYTPRPWHTQHQQVTGRLLVEREKRRVDLRKKIHRSFHTIEVEADRFNCFYRAIARSSRLFEFNESAHEQVRFRLFGHLANVFQDPKHPLHQHYQEILHDFFPDKTPSSLIASIRQTGTSEGMGGIDYAVFLVNALGVNIIIYDVKEGNEHHLDMEGAPQDVDTIHLWFAKEHYKALIPK